MAMFLHKFNIGDGSTIYRVSDKSGKPTAKLQIPSDSWRGKALGRYDTVIGQLNDLTFTMDVDSVDEEGKEKGKEKPVLKKVRKRITARIAAQKSIVTELDKIASELQAVGEENLALALDQVCDCLEGRE